MDHAMVIRADARAMGAVTALSTTNRRKPRTYTSASECISYKDGVATIFRAASKTRTRKPNRVTFDAPHRITAADLAPIGDQNH